MKYIILTFIIMLSFSGCSKNNAFDNFDLTKNQEKSMNSLQSSRIFYKQNSDGIFSAIYLNNIYPKKFKDEEYFFVYFYTKSKAKNIKLKLNNILAIKMQKLPSENEFTDLVKTKTNWNNYYLVTFKKQDKKNLNLTFENYPYTSDQLVYLKDL